MSAAVATPVAARAPGAGELRGTGSLVRFALRRDRVRLPGWVLGITVTLVLVAASFPGIYPDAAAREARALIMQSPGAVAFGGPAIGVEDYTFGAMMTNEMLGLTAVVVALMSIFTVVRHTRADEETGRTELVLAFPVGRRAPLAAAVVVMVLANVTLAVLVGAGLGALGMAGMDWGGSWLFAVALVSVGLVFGALAAVTAQVSEHGRTASGLAGLALGVAYLVRAVGDVADSGLSWVSPIAWAQRTYAYVDDRWWPLALSLAATAGLVAVASALRARRDIAAGLRQPRPGRAQGSTALTTPFGLVARLQRGSILGWTLSLLGFGLVYGTLLGEVENFAGDLETVEAVLSGIGGELLIQSFLALLSTILSMTAVIFGLTAVVRARTEESAGRAEAVLATPVSRGRYLAAHAGVAALGSVAALLAGALGIGISGGATVGDAEVLGDMLLAGLVQTAPVLAVVGLAVALYGWFPRALGLVWAVLGASFFVGMFGGLLGLSPWVMDLSPFSMVPMVPAEPFDAVPVVAMLAVALALAVLGVVGLRRRDLTTTA